MRARVVFITALGTVVALLLGAGCDPARVVLASDAGAVSVGQTFVVRVEVRNRNPQAHAFRLQYPDALLQHVPPIEHFHANGEPALVPGSSAGEIDVQAAVTRGPASPTHPDKGRVLAELTFEAIAPGEAEISLAEAAIGQGTAPSGDDPVTRTKRWDPKLGVPLIIDVQ